MSNNKALIAGLGEVTQLAFVPKDMDAALTFWIEVMGVGPFFRRTVTADEVRYKGEPADIQFEVAISYWNDMQVELIRQLNDAPSIYKSWRDAGLEGVHHTCIVVDDIAAARALCVAKGREIMQEVAVGSILAFYADTGGGPGTMLEVIQVGDAARARFAMIREAARTWDGSDPIR